MARFTDILLLDNNAVRKLEHEPTRRRLEANLRTTGRDFWPTAINVMEALKSRDREIRTRLLTNLAELAGDAHAMPLPTEALKKVAEAFATRSPTFTWSEPAFTALFRNPAAVTDEQAAQIREHPQEQEDSFDAAHERAMDEVRPVLGAEGGRDRWPTVGAFLNEVWDSPNHLGEYAKMLWDEWGFGGVAPVDALLGNTAWRLYFEGWGAAMYARILAHPQPPKVEQADLLQLVYCGAGRSAVLASDDRGFQELGNAILRGRYNLLEVVPLKAVAS